MLLPLAYLIELCRVLRHSLGAGVSLVKVFEQQARSGPAAQRPLVEGIHRDLAKGATLEDALLRHPGCFPPVFLALTTVGEKAGRLPDIFGELERYFVLRQRLRRQLRTQSVRPVLQFVIAVLVIALLIWVLGMIAAAHDTTPLDPLGLGLVGGRGALLFLGLAFGIPAALILVYRFARHRLAMLEVWLLRVPLIGPSMRALALVRFCLALRLTQEAGMLADEALALSLRATDHAAFTATAQRVQQAARGGQRMNQALDRTGLFPEEFMHVLTVAEESGQVPEVMRRQAEHYQDEAERRLQALTKMAGVLVWLVTAAFIIWAIFRIFINVYLNALEGI